MTRFDLFLFFFFQAEDGIRDWSVTGVQTCALPICVMSVGGLSAKAGCAESRAASVKAGNRARGRFSDRRRRGPLLQRQSVIRNRDLRPGGRGRLLVGPQKYHTGDQQEDRKSTRLNS